MPRGYACRVDDNQKDVVSAMRAAGAYVIDTSKMGNGFPDLIVGFRGVTLLMEVKNPKTQYGRAGLNKRQKSWHAEWTGGPLSTVDGPEAALRALGCIK